TCSGSWATSGPPGPCAASSSARWTRAARKGRSPRLRLPQAARSPSWPGGGWRQHAWVARVGALQAAAGFQSGCARGPHTAAPPSPTRTARCGMEQLRIPKLLAGALAAVSGAVVASFFGVEGTLIGAALVSMLVAPAEAVYTHSLASAHRVARRSLVRRVGDQAGASEEAAGAGTRGEAAGERAGRGGRSRGAPPADPLAAGRGRGGARLWDRGRRDHGGGGGRQPAA